MVQLLSPATVALAGRILPCPCCGTPTPCDRLAATIAASSSNCGDRTLVMGEGSRLYRRPRVVIPTD